jgi:hypothetical protein
MLQKTWIRDLQSENYSNNVEKLRKIRVIVGRKHFQQGEKHKRVIAQKNMKH